MPTSISFGSSSSPIKRQPLPAAASHLSPRRAGKNPVPFRFSSGPLMLRSSRFDRRIQQRVLKQTRSRAGAFAIRQLMGEQLEERTMLAGLGSDLVGRPTAAEHELLLQFKPGVSAALQSNSLATVGGTVIQSLQRLPGGAPNSNGVQRIRLPDSISLDAAISSLASNPNVKYAEPNWIYQPSVVSNDPVYLIQSQMWGMYSDDSPANVGPSGTTNQFGSQAEEAWNVGYTGDRSVVVGVIDEGIQFTHPDLVNNVWTNPFDPVDGIDNDNNGFVDDIHGWDFWTNDNSIYDGPVDDHGTHVAGTIGAEGGNSQGVVGVNWKTTMISTKFLGPQGGFTSGAVQALDYLVDLKTRHGINIVATNNSWGGGGFSQTLLDAIVRAANAGILFVAAAGNAGVNNDTTASYPSNYNTTLNGANSATYDSVIAVASLTSTGDKAGSSSYGLLNVDLGAPGAVIASTVPDASYAYYSGTSMATPHVTGAIALYATYQPGATASSIRNAILSSVTPTPSMNGFTVTGGRLSVSTLMQTVTGPSFSINDVSLTEGNSGTKTATFTVSLSASFGNTLAVNYATANGTATSGSDYIATSGTLTFAPGVKSQTISVTISGDPNFEGNETFFVNLTPTAGLPPVTITDAQGQATIQNDDALPPTLAGVTVNNGVGFTNTVQRSQIVSLTVSFSGPVTLDPNAFTLENIGLFTAGSSFVPAGQLTYTSGVSAASFVITFGVGPGNVDPIGTVVNGVVKRGGGSAAVTDGNSLADGNYVLTIDPTKVHQSDTQSLSGNNRFGALSAERFFRMFGDSDGDGDVDGSDTVNFRRAQTALQYNAALDWDGNGSVSIGVDSTNFSANNSKKRRLF